MTVDLNTVLAALFGTGFFVSCIKLILERRKRRADTSKTDAQTEAIHQSTEAKRITALGTSNTTIEGLLEEAEKHIKKMRDTNSQLVAAQTENEFLSTSLKNAKAIIDYQKTERHEWTEQLKGVLEELGEARVEIRSLQNRVSELEGFHNDGKPPF